MMDKLDGKKTLLGIIIAVAPQVIDAIGQVLSAAGGNVDDYVKIAGGVLAVLGIIHKLLKD